MAREAIILVPGFFGFGSFGSGPEKITYFDQVAASVASFAGLPGERVICHEPGPTEPLAWRVRSLYELVQRVLAGEEERLGPVDRVHLIGHSTGGVDVRLLVNTSYYWPGGPIGPARSAQLPRIGAMVSLSAPQWGTPLARRLRGALENALPELYLASILAKHRRFAWFESLLLTPLVLGRSPDDGPSRLTQIMKGLPTELSDEVSRFIKHIRDDHGLIHDLTPAAMDRLNSAVEAGENARMKYFVTAAPSPSVTKVVEAGIQGQGLRSAIYATAASMARPEPTEQRAFPGGPWLGDTPIGHNGDTTDGVVPAGAQVLRGPASAIVSADHLDVVGHYASQRFRGNTLFLSGAAFDDRRFDVLWSAIAREITAVRRAAA